MVSFPRRIAALLYDAISLLALIYFASFIPVFLTQGFIEAESLKFQIFLVIFTAAYFVFCWRRSQTLGMTAWDLSLRSVKGGIPTFSQLSIRFIVATISFLFFGLGYFWALFNTSQKTWHDIASDTHLIRRK